MVMQYWFVQNHVLKIWSWCGVHLLSSAISIPCRSLAFFTLTSHPKFHEEFFALHEQFSGLPFVGPEGWVLPLVKVHLKSRPS